MSQIRVFLVDDEPPARRRLRRLLEDFPAFETVGEAGTVAEALRLMPSLRPEMIFLDIEMPGGDGFALMAQIDIEPRPCIVLLTAHQQFALRAYEHAVFDYVLKPVAPARFAAVMRRLQSHLRPDLKTAEYARQIMVPLPDRAIALAVEQLDLIESERNYVRLHANGTSYQIRSSLTELADQLDPAQFRQISRSAIVRIGAILETASIGHGELKLTLRNGREATWTRRYRDQMPQSLRC
jgi:two-component system LytT family response regulator